jgi:hypothetical protein
VKLKCSTGEEKRFKTDRHRRIGERTDRICSVRRGTNLGLRKGEKRNEHAGEDHSGKSVVEVMSTHTSQVCRGKMSRMESMRKVMKVRTTSSRMQERKLKKTCKQVTCGFEGLFED